MINVTIFQWFDVTGAGGFCPIAFIVVFLFHMLLGEANARSQNQTVKLVFKNDVKNK